MGQCVSKAGSEQRGNTRKSSFQSGPEMTVGPDGVEVPVDNRPVLQQQPRRKSVEGSSLPPAPHREMLDPRKQAVTVTSSQLEFFKMLDEKIEKGVVPEDEEGAGEAGASPVTVPTLPEEEPETGTQGNAETTASNRANDGEAMALAEASPTSESQASAVFDDSATQPLDPAADNS